jgi:CRP-like cAMP-binding protein
VIADNVRESSFAPGHEVAQADARLAALHLVLEGRIEARFGDQVDSWGPREVFGLLEVLANRPMSAPAISAGATRSLRLSAGDAREILEDNFGVLYAVIRGLATRFVSLGARVGDVAIPSQHRLTLVERLIVLRQLAPFNGSRLHALAAVARNCEELVLPAGHRVATCGQGADLSILLDGVVHAERLDADAAQPLRAGASFGAIEAIAGLRHRADLTTSTPARVLRCPAAALIDILEDHADLGLVIVNNIATALLDLPRLPRLEHDLHSHWS